MSYTPLNWTNEVPASMPVKYKISQTTDGDICTDATIELVTSVTPGTAMNASNFNHMEQGIEDANETAALAVETANAAVASVEAATDAAAHAESVAAGAVTTANAAIPKIVMQAEGDIIMGMGAGLVNRLAAGSEGLTLKIRSGVPAWSLPLGAIQRRSTSQGISNNTITVITMDTNRYNEGVFIVSNRPTFPNAGYTAPCLCCVWGYFDGTEGGVGVRQVGVKHTRGAGVTYYWGSGYPADSEAAWASFVAVIPCEQGDIVEMVVLQTSGGSLNFSNANLAVIQL